MLKKLLTFITALLISYTSFGQHISAGRGHSIFLCSDGTVRTWGDNSSGQLGQGDLIAKKLPKTIPGLTNVIAVSAGGKHSLFLKSDGTVWACGNNDLGQLGHSNAYSTIPVQISGLTGITQISAGYDYSLFLKNDGTVWACGYNGYGQLGDGTTTNRSIPFQISGLTGITKISAGLWHSLFLKNDGTVKGCGENLWGQLGTATITLKELTPVNVIGLTGIDNISAGSSDSFFLKNDGTVYRTDPNNGGTTKVTGLTGIISVSNSGTGVFFLKNDGTVWTSGQNKSGELGLGSNNAFENATTQIPGITGITEISLGKSKSYFHLINYFSLDYVIDINHSLLLKNDGTALASGDNSLGQLGDGTSASKNTHLSLGNICIPPTPPQVNFSNFPTSLCVGSAINIEPNVAGSLPALGFSIDNSINVTAPKNIARNSHLVFVLDATDKIMSYDFDGNLQNTYNASSSITGLTTFAPDENDNVWVHNATTKRLVRLGPGGVNDTSSIASFMLSSAGDPKFTDMAFTDGPIVENLILADTSSNTPDLMNGIDVSNSNPNSNYTWGLSDSIITKFLPNQHLITSIAFDNRLYAERRMLFADPQHNTLWQRKFFGGNWFGSAKPLVDTAITSGMALDFIDADTIASWGGLGGTPITVSSSTKNIVGLIWTNVDPNGEVISYLDTVTISAIVTQSPVGIVSASNNNMPQFWIADKGLNKLIRAQMISYRLTPNLPAGLKFNTVTGKVEGSPTGVIAPQTYQLIVTNGLGSDTTYFTFGVTPTGPLSNAVGTSSTSGTQSDGLTIKYYDPNNCSELLEIADRIGGTSPGQTQISQTVYPLVSVIANDSLIRRVNSIRAQNQDALTVNIKLFYSYQDIQAFNITRGSALLSNDTLGGTMQMAVLQMHDKPDGSKEPIVHSPITAVWSTPKRHWEATVPVTKFSEFYGSDIATLAAFSCTNTGTQTLNLSALYYVWNNDTLFASGAYVDTLINKTGCDSIATLNLTLSPTGISELSSNNAVSVYPNPNNGLLNIRFVSNTVIPSRIRIVNVIGNEVYNEAITGNTQIDLRNLTSGTYFVTIETNEKPLVYRIVKE